MEEDIEAILKTAAHTHTPYNRHKPLNALSSLPSSKAKIRIAIKKRIRYLASTYISLATFIDDDYILFMEHNPKSKSTMAIYMQVIKDIEKSEKELENFKIIL